MKKYLLSFFLIIAFAFYVVLNNQSSMDVAPANGPVAVNTNTGGGTSANAPAEPTPAPTPTPIPTPAPAAQTGLYKDGSYTGSVADAYFGKLQVKAVVQNRKLSDVQILQYPSDQGTSRRINNNALPQLVREALGAQNANVNVVSGATQSSEAFQQSLAAALAQAKA